MRRAVDVAAQLRTALALLCHGRTRAEHAEVPDSEIEKMARLTEQALRAGHGFTLRTTSTSGTAFTPSLSAASQSF